MNLSESYDNKIDLHDLLGKLDEDGENMRLNTTKGIWDLV